MSVTQQTRISDENGERVVPTAKAFKMGANLAVAELYCGPKVEKTTQSLLTGLHIHIDNSWFIWSTDDREVGREIEVFKGVTDSPIRFDGTILPLDGKLIGHLNDCFYDLGKDNSCVLFYQHPCKIFKSLPHPSGKILFEASDGIHLLSCDKKGIALIETIAEPERGEWESCGDEIFAIDEGVCYRKKNKFLVNMDVKWSSPVQWDYRDKWMPFASGIAYQNKGGIITYHADKTAQAEVMYERLNPEKDQWVGTRHSQLLVLKGAEKLVLVGRRQPVGRRFKKVPATLCRPSLRLSMMFGDVEQFEPHPWGVQCSKTYNTNSEKLLQRISAIIVK